MPKAISPGGSREARGGKCWLPGAAEVVSDVKSWLPQQWLEKRGGPADENWGEVFDISTQLVRSRAGG